MSSSRQRVRSSEEGRTSVFGISVQAILGWASSQITTEKGVGGPECAR